MQKVESLSVAYVGYSKPATAEEVDFEILGLETVIAQAKQRIAVLNQSTKLTELMTSSVVEDEPDNEETVEPAADSEKAE